MISLHRQYARRKGVMHRLNFLADEPWDEQDDDDRTRVRWFGHAFTAGHSSAPPCANFCRVPQEAHCTCTTASRRCSSSSPVHRPFALRRARSGFRPETSYYFPEGPDGLHDFSNPTGETVRLLAVSSKRFPDVVAYPEQGYAWVGSTTMPSVRCPKAGTTGSSPASTCPRASDPTLGLPGRR